MSKEPTPILRKQPWERMARHSREELLNVRPQRRLGRITLAILAVFVIILFLPWRQTIPGRGVVTALASDGAHLDWGRVDDDVRYRLALPGAGRYVLVASAEGWATRSQIVQVEGPDLPQFSLVDPLQQHPERLARRR